MRTRGALCAILLSGTTACSSMQPIGVPHYIAPDWHTPDTLLVLPITFANIWREDARHLDREFVDSLRAADRVGTVLHTESIDEQSRRLLQLLARQRDGLRLPDSASVCQLSARLGTRYLLYLKVQRFDDTRIDGSVYVRIRAEVWDGATGQIRWSGMSRSGTPPPVVGHIAIAGQSDLTLGQVAFRQMLDGFLGIPRHNGNPRL